MLVGGGGSNDDVLADRTLMSDSFVFIVLPVFATATALVDAAADSVLFVISGVMFAALA